MAMRPNREISPAYRPPEPRLMWALALLLTASVCWSAAHFAYELRYPAGSGGRPNPSGLFTDHRTGEIYVADAANSRIVIYDQRGQYNFEFSTREHLASPRHIAVDSLGRIFVVGDTRYSSLAVFDYDGDFLSDWRLTYPNSDSLLDISSFTIDRNDRLYFLTANPGHVYVYTSDGNAVTDFAVFQELDKTTQQASLLGRIAVIEDHLVIPMPMVSQVVRYTTAGKFVNLFGISGGGPGELSHPIAVADDGNGGFLVLDKHRHTVLQCTGQGKYVREFGGMGFSPGWLYHPFAMVSDNFGNAIIAQGYMNRIQALAISNTANSNATLTETDGAAPSIRSTE